MKVKIDLTDEQNTMLVDIISQSQGVSSEEVEENLDQFMIKEIIEANRSKFHLMGLEDETVEETFEEFLEELE